MCLLTLQNKGEADSVLLRMHLRETTMDKGIVIWSAIGLWVKIECVHEYYLLLM